METAFKDAVAQLDARISGQDVGFEDVLTEEIVSNSEIEGVLLDRDSIHSSFVENIIPAREKEIGAVQLARMALMHYNEPLSHELLYEMHRAILSGTWSFPEESVGAYVGGMKVVSGTRIDREPIVIHQGVSKATVQDHMTRFIEWHNACSPEAPLLNAIQGYVHFETLHPFCDGNGRIGRSLTLMGLCRDLGRGLHHWRFRGLSIEIWSTTTSNLLRRLI